MDIFKINHLISIGDGIKHRDTNIALYNSKYETIYEGKSKGDGTFLDTTTTDFPHKYIISNNRISGEYLFADIIDIRFIDNKTGLYMISINIFEDKDIIRIRIPERYSDLLYYVLKTVQNKWIGKLNHLCIFNDNGEVGITYDLSSIY